MGAESFLTLQIVDFAEGVDDRVAALLTAGTGITITYNDGAGTLTIANTGLGGSTGSTDNRILRADGTGGSTVQNSAVTIDDSGNISGLGTVGCGAITTSGEIILSDISGGNIRWTGGSQIFCGVNGRIALYQSNLADFGLLQLGGTSASFPALKRNGAALEARLANDSGVAAFICGAITASGNINLRNNDTIRWDSGTATVLFDGTGLQLNRSATQYVMYGNQHHLTGSFVKIGGTTNPAPYYRLQVHGDIAIRDSGSIQVFNTFTATNNFESLRQQWTSNEARIGTAVGSAGGTQRNMVLGSWNTAGTWTPALTVNNVGAITASGLVNVGTYTVETLPSAAANAGALAQVTDSSVTANGSAVAGGGSNRVVVFSNRSTWNVVVA